MNRQAVTLTPINEAEAVIEPFWDERLSGLQLWSIDQGRAHGLRVFQNWCWVGFEWQRRPDAGPALRMVRRFDVPCRDYDRLVVSVMAPEGSIVRITAQTDKGIRQFRSPPSPLLKQEHVLELEGASRVEAVTLEIDAALEGVAAGWLNWIGLQDSHRLEGYLRRLDRFDDRWDGYLKPESYEPCFTPSYGLVLSVGELEALLRRHQELLSRKNESPFVAAARQAARTPPERLIGDYVSFCDDTRYNRQRDHGKHLLTHGPNAAIAGHLLRDKSLLRLAGRYALAIASCTHWDDGFICRFPGSTFDHRCFVESLCAYDVAAILDLAGEMFTGLGRGYLMRRLTLEGLASIQYNTWRCEYIFGCNQLAWFTPGRMLAMAVLEKDWPRVRDYREIAYRELVESLNQTILPDGGYVEGPTYFRCVGRDAGLSFYHYSRSVGKPLPDVVPDVMKRCGDFAEAIISTDDSADVIPICDARASHEPLSQVMMAHALPESAWARMGRKTLEGPVDWLSRSLPGRTVPSMLDNAIAWQIGESLSLQADNPRPFVFLPDMGVMTSHRTIGGKPVKILIQGNKANAGHAHEDKGSFVLEFAGETLAMDPGTCSYSSPLAEILKHCQRHNMLVPVGLPWRACPKNPLPADVKPTGRGDETSFHAQIDAAPGWEPYFKEWRRTWDSPTPDKLVIEDEYELSAGQAVEFYWQTRLPVNISGCTATIEGRHGIALLEAPADCTWRIDELPLPDGVQRRLAIRKTATKGTFTVTVVLRAR